MALAARVFLGMPWLWGFMLGFVLAAVSPAVVVSCLLNLQVGWGVLWCAMGSILQERGFGVAKGIPTLVIAAGGHLPSSSFGSLLRTVAFPSASTLFPSFHG